MPETPIKDEPQDSEDAIAAAVEDQRRRGYYYDDACGYEVYDPDSDVDEDDAEPDDRED